MRSWEDVHRADRRDYRRAPAESVVRVVPSLRETGATRVIDLGCGAGRNTVFLAKQGFMVVGIDESVSAVKRADEWTSAEDIKNVVLMVGKAQNLPFPDGHFDAVVSINVIHHAMIKQIEETVGEMWRILKKGGTGVVTVSSDLDYKFSRGKQVDYKTYELDMETHREKGVVHRFFNEQEARALFREFEITGVRRLMEEAEKGQNWHWEVTFAKPT